jgi:hypothetical protein
MAFAAADPAPRNTFLRRPLLAVAQQPFVALLPATNRFAPTVHLDDLLAPLEPPEASLRDRLA